jgi:type II secretion system protein I
MRHTTPGRLSGFTLLEIMVALSILSLSLVAIMNLFSQGIRMTGVAEEYTLATILARSKMSEVLMEKELEVSTEAGEFEEFERRFSYETAIEEYELPYLVKEDGLDFSSTQAGVAEEELFKTFKVTVKVKWNDGRRNVELISLRTDYVLPEQQE